MEIWKAIPGYEDLYEASSTGFIRRVHNRHGKVINRVLSGCGNGKYKQVQLCKNAIVTHYPVHRLIALAFIPNPNNYPYVAHKDDDGANNTVSNLYWATPEMNWEDRRRNSGD